MTRNGSSSRNNSFWTTSFIKVKRYLIPFLLQIWILRILDYSIKCLSLIFSNTKANSSGLMSVLTKPAENNLMFWKASSNKDLSKNRQGKVEYALSGSSSTINSSIKSFVKQPSTYPKGGFSSWRLETIWKWLSRHTKLYTRAPLCSETERLT